MTHPKIDELQDVSMRLRDGSPLVHKRILRNADGRIIGANETHHRFDAHRLAKSGQRILNELATADLDHDERLLANACVADFLDSVAPYSSTPHAAEQRTLARELRSALGLVE